MPIIVEWHNAEKTIVLQRYEGRWTWDEFYAACTQDSAGLMKSVTHTVHLFADFSQAQGVPIGGTMLHARNVMQHYPENWGTLTIIGANHFVKLLVDMFKKSFATNLGRRTFTAATFEDAYKQIAAWQPLVDTPEE